MHLDDEPPVAQHIPTRIISVGHNFGQSSLDEDKASESESSPMKRSRSINSTLAAEIYHLRRLLEQKDRDVTETRRSFDALRESREDVGILSDGTPGGSIGKGTLANELRTAKKETAQWKKRAEWAEGRLAVVDQTRKADAEEPTVKPVETAAHSTPGKGSSTDGKPKFWLHE